jgi:prepilin-type N-terminal cleavage/methylation domain-containing protein
MTNPMLISFRLGFSLSELLISMAILGVIASFSIPKILQSQQDTQFKTIAKETAGMLAGAYDACRLNGNCNATSDSRDLSQYMNYVILDTVSIIDSYNTDTSIDCSSGSAGCLQLHNGAILKLSSANFAGSATTNAIYVDLDPDGKYSGISSGPSKGVRFFLYYNGRIATYGTISPGTVSSNGTRNPDPARDPSWFSWD